MALDKLVDSGQLDTDLTSVANAIRSKGGTSGQLAFPAGFVSAVQAIPTGSTPTGTKQISITANGTTTEDVSLYANVEVTVDVPASGMTFSKVTQAILLKNARSSGNITFNRLSYNANTIVCWSGQSVFTVGNTNNFSDYVTDGTHIWFRAVGVSTVKYNGVDATFSRDTSSAVIMLTIPDNYDNTIPFELS